MPSGALNEFECTVDGANTHQSHFQRSSIGDVCWKLQQDSRPESPVRCSVTGNDSNNSSDPSTEPVLKSDDGDKLHGNVKGTKDELAKIREGFDAWLAAFRKSRPHRDVIWRVGKQIKECSVTGEEVEGILRKHNFFYFFKASVECHRPKINCSTS